jgi:hypothetical protein
VRLRRALLKDTATVRTYTGEGSRGPVYAPAVSVLCDVQGWRRLVRNGNGDEVTSEFTLRLHPHTEDETTGAVLDPAALLAPESRVEVRGRMARVLSVTTHTQRGHPVMVEVTTT